MNETTKIQSQKLRKMLCCALGLMGVVSGGDAQCYDARPDPMVLPLVGAPVAPPVVAKATTNKINMTLSACEGVKTLDDPQGQLGGTLDPAGWYQVYMQNKFGKYIPIDGAKATLLVGPTHGRIENFGYIPNHGFLGQDKVIHLVEVDGKRIKVITMLYVDNHGLHCEGDAGDVKRISSTNTLDLTTGLAALLTATQLSGQFANSGITLNFTDLPSQLGRVRHANAVKTV